MIVTKGATDVTTYVMMVDSAAGTPETGLTISNFDLQYTRNQSSPAAKVDAVALAATNTAHTDNRGIEIDATSSPGLYRVDWPDAAFATGADKVILVVTCSGCAPAVIAVDLVNYNAQDGVRLGLTALPNAAADAAGGLPISDAGGLDLDSRLDAAVSSRMATYVQPTGFLTATFPAGTVANTTNITAGTITTATNLTNAPTNGDFTAAMKTSIGTAVAASAVASVTAPVTVGTNNDKTGYALTASYDFAKGTTAMTEAYAANGAAPTPVQAFYAIHQMLMQFAISGTDLTVKKLDNSTTAFVVTLDDASNPTSAARV